MKLIIVHYHLRPGGIRRIIELATPHLVRAFGGRIEQVTLASGEVPDRKWRRAFLQALNFVPVSFHVEPAFGYISEQQRCAPSTIRAEVRKAIERLLAKASAGDCIVWAHNLGLARNLLLTRELVRTCERRQIPLLAHHHDWWFDNRWQRWQEVRRTGFKTLASTAEAVFGSPKTRHISINHSDWNILKEHFFARASWLPNLADRTPNPPAARVRNARRWLQARLDHKDAPVWILPCRLLRRKNVAEALLLKRWLRPEAWLVTTGDVSSAEEQSYYDELSAAARKHHWRLRLAVLSGDESRKPAVAELLAASEAVLLTSIQEGFGLPILEAAAASCPLVTRNLPNITADLTKFGFSFPQSYDEILVHPSLLDWDAEQEYQQRLFENWKRQMPRRVRTWVGTPAVLRAGRKPKAVPFSRLRLSAQIEVLTQPASKSWELCTPLNPFLIEWRRRAQRGRLLVTPWPRGADRWLSGEAYARRFREALDASSTRMQTQKAPIAAQRDFIRLKLESRYLYPLLWNTEK